MTEPTFLSQTRAAYDAVAEAYVEVLRGELEEKPFNLAMLEAFAALVRAGPGGPVLDAGCGPGRLTPYLRGLGLAVQGIDLSPRMVEVARREHPEETFRVGSLTALPVDDASMAGVVAWYSLIHVPPDEQLPVLAELRRVLAAGGVLLLAFQVGADEHVHREEAYGVAVPLDSFRLDPARVEEQLDASGFRAEATLICEPSRGETTQQAFLVARVREVRAMTA